MENEDIHSCIIDIHKPRVFAKGSDYLMKIHSKSHFKRRPERQLRKPSETALTKYSLLEEKPLPKNVPKREEFLLSYKQYEKKQNSLRHVQRLAISIYDKYKILSTDLLKRLYVEHPPDDVRALTDIDEGYFRYVDGRPSFYAYVPLNKSLKYLFHNQLRIRQEVGYREDTMLNIDINYKKEQETYNLAVQKCVNQAKYFDKFISEDYYKSMAFLGKWEKLKVKVFNQNIELQNLATERFTIISKLVGLDYMFSLQQKYGRFLYYISPAIWRSQNRGFARSVEIEAKGFDFGGPNDEDTFTVMFEKMQSQCDDFVTPALYFTRSEDLMNVFETMEKQQLYNFTHVARRTLQTRSLKKGITLLRDSIAQDIAAVTINIEGFETLFKFYEERCIELEARFFKILHGSFYQSVGSIEVLKYFVHLAFCYEKIFEEKPNNLDMINMARAIENCYMNYTKRLEDVRSAKVREAILKCQQIEKQKNKRAKIAARELRSFERLQQELLRAFAPPMTKKSYVTIPPVKRAPVLKKTKQRNSESKVKENKKKCLTDAEVEYLSLFTDWTETEDPSKYLYSFHMADEELELGP